MCQRLLQMTVITVAVTLSLTAPAIGQDDSARKAKTRDNLKAIGLAFHNYHDVFGHFPISTHDKNGKPLLSWRVQILPFVEARELFNEFRRDEPWDSEHNRQLIAKMPDVFKVPGVDQPEKTVYLEPVGPKAMFPRDKSDPRKPREATTVRINNEPRVLELSVGVRDILDGTVNTIMVIEADPKMAVTWTKPDDLEFDAEKPKAGLGGIFDGGFHALMGDASVHFIPLTTSDKVLLDLFNLADGHAIPEGLLK